MPKEVSPDLVSGFFIAMISFGQELANQEIQFIQMSQIRIYFHVVDRFVLTMATTHEIRPEQATTMLKKVQVRFNEKYRNVLSKGFMGETSVFNNFASDVEEIVATKSQSLVFIEEQTELIKNYYDSAKKEWQSIKLQMEQRAKTYEEESKNSLIPILGKVKGQINVAKGVFGEIKKTVVDEIKKKVKKESASSKQLPSLPATDEQNSEKK